MELTGKCLEGFNKWKQNKGIENFNVKNYSLDVAKSIYNAILVCFFDSVNIKILLEKHIDDWWYLVYEYLEENEFGCKKHIQKSESKNRIECTKEAIKKANEIYNSKHEIPSR